MKTGKTGGAVALDTNILIWALKGECSEGQEKMIEKARALLEHLTEKKITIVVPSIVLAECMVQVPAEDRPDFVSMCKDRFIVHPFDTGASVHYARIETRVKGRRNPPCNESGERARQRVKVDHFILASVISSGAKVFYTHDMSLAKVAVGDVEVLEMPDYHKPKQHTLLGRIE